MAGCASLSPITWLVSLSHPNMDYPLSELANIYVRFRYLKAKGANPVAVWASSHNFPELRPNNRIAQRLFQYCGKPHDKFQKTLWIFWLSIRLQSRDLPQNRMILPGLVAIRDTRTLPIGRMTKKRTKSQSSKVRTNTCLPIKTIYQLPELKKQSLLSSLEEYP